MTSSSSARVWFITGCSSGFGRALAEEVIARGDQLIATARDVTALAYLEDRARCLALDVTNAAQVHEVMREAHAVHGRLDVLVNNAGYGLIGAIEECSDAEITQCMATNFHGPLNVMRTALPFLRAQGSGHIVNISAAATVSNYAGFGIYGAAKAALEAASEAVRAEVAPLGIKVTLVVPGPFRTDFIARSLHRAAHTEPAYAKTSGQFASILDRMNGRQPGDPKRAATIIFDMIQNGQAPLRLPLGKYLVDKIRKRNAASEREVAEWESIAITADA
jgi:NAD(P)-dependent dehydrogenase (short-subunit alcohol dehydrogenase family)